MTCVTISAMTTTSGTPSNQRMIGMRNLHCHPTSIHTDPSAGTTRLMSNGSNQMGLPTYMQEILIGLVIILAVGLDKLRQRRRL